MTDKNVNTPVEDDDFFDNATGGFPKVDHLAPSLYPKYGMGRLIAVWPTEKAFGKPKRAGDPPYTLFKTITLVLDDGPQGKVDGEGWDPETLQFVPPVADKPARYDNFQHSTTWMVSLLERRWTARNPRTDVPMKFRPVIGRMETQGSSNNPKVAAYALREATEAELDKIRNTPAWKNAIIQINQELEKAAQQAEDDKAFDGN